jgi:cellulose synthase (UDP-forming)
VLSVLLNPWKPSFKVTPKGVTNHQDYLSPMAAPFFLVIGINIVAVVLASIRWFTEPILRDVIAVTAIWSLYNLYLSLVSLGAFWERKQVRKFYRTSASGPVTAYFSRMGTSHTGEVLDVSVTGIGFEMELPFLPREHEQVVLEVKDSYGREYRFENHIQRAVKHGNKYFCGTEFIPGRVSNTDVVGYVFGDSRRWQDNWERKSRAHGTYRMLWYFMKTGVKGFLGGVLPLTWKALVRLWKLGVRWATTPVLQDEVLAAASWLVYYFYVMLATLVELLDRKHVRKLQRFQSSGAATVYFPRVDATLQGEVTDVSLTGIGVMTTVPFELHEHERVVIKTTGRAGREEQFSCLIQRAIKQDGKLLCGAEFIVDVFNYPGIVRFIYGDSLHMLRIVLTPGSGLSTQGKAAVVHVASRMMKRVVAVLSLIFLNPESNAKQKQ